MGSKLTSLPEGEGVDCDERHRGGPEDADDAREYLEHNLVDQHEAVIKVIDKLSPDLVNQVKEMLGVEDLTDQGDVRSAVAGLNGE